ncbi:hypothetical protein XENTR_v10012069 [Xenopus tropicalis]|uniref:Intraflagellar transport protein 25 homolog isoform X1 n=1 Tax=Xenopus tropicalis TaxID=8364 RepID=A0A8J0SLR5_XENTR|nr:intraflagellar transport protein 25 homolog isoform X1 [Xenopus tropicalis]KAE8610274.1 hypothetical protein XENTR_v10012069 [Xenopus tropicalis]|eukprot:XP_012816704.1 PREDICTED: intraflagellar transport protein 25 homolog isoform X1 [Xenopus tropicalis]
MTRAGDLCLSCAGARVTLATSSDDRHPADNIIDGNPDTFWTTTVRSVRIESSTSKEPVNFELRLERDLENTEGHLQYEEFTLPGVQVAHMRFVILSGFDHFVSVHRVSAEGDK